MAELGVPVPQKPRRAPGLGDPELGQLRYWVPDNFWQGGHSPPFDPPGGVHAGVGHVNHCLTGLVVTSGDNQFATAVPVGQNGA